MEVEVEPERLEFRLSAQRQLVGIRQVDVPVIGPFSYHGKSHIVKSVSRMMPREVRGKVIGRWFNETQCGHFNSIGNPHEIHWVQAHQVTCMICRDRAWKLAKRLQERTGINDVEILSDWLLDQGDPNPLLPFAAAIYRPLSRWQE